MDLDIKKVVKRTKKALRHFPVFFALHAWTVFTIVALIVLVYGFLIFYQNAYSLPGKQYDVFLKARSVNSGNLSKAKEFVEEKEDRSLAIPSRNPFVR